MEERTIKKTARARSSIISEKLSEIGLEKDSVLLSLFHFHDALGSEIAWNDVQAINAHNNFIEVETMNVPEEATEGYNQHHHTSDFDGGLLPGVRGIHDHRDNLNGGFCYSVFHPATSCPMAAWDR